MSAVESPPEREGGLPSVVLIVAYVVMLVGTVVLGAGVLMANVMACDSGGDNCATGVGIATVTWGVISFVLPVVALVWGLVSSRATRRGRISRIIALVLIIVLPVLGLAANLTILFLPVFH